MEYKGFIKGSRTLDKETLLGLSGLVVVFQDKLPLVQENLGSYYGMVVIAFAVVGYWLRLKTTSAVGEKKDG